MFGAGIDKSRYPDLQQAWGPLDEAFDGCVGAICEGDPAATAALGTAAKATAHGYAMQMLDGTFGRGEDVLATVTALAARAVLALIQGRTALQPPGEAVTPASGRE